MIQVKRPDANLVATHLVAVARLNSLIRCGIKEHTRNRMRLVTKLCMIAFLQESSMYFMKKSLGECVAEIHLFVGERENKRILLSARKLHETLEKSSLRRNRRPHS